MNINDIHTHHLSREKAIISLTPDKWNPESGKYYSVGLHPWTLTEDYEEQWQMVMDIVNNSDQVVAIGETGVDRVRGISVDVQLHSMMRHISLSEILNKPLILHCVRATSDILHLHKKINHKQPWIIHGFRGNKCIAMQMYSEGIYISVGEKYNKDAMQCVPIDKLLIESDESVCDIEDIYQSVARDRGISEEELKDNIQKNIGTIWGAE